MERVPFIVVGQENRLVLIAHVLFDLADIGERALLEIVLVILVLVVVVQKSGAAGVIEAQALDVL